jgi:tRNA-2-methylthio-N6-dimethylallyladenosine synthase
MQAVHADAPERLIGRVVDVRIEEAHPNSLAGTVVTDVVDGVPRSEGRSPNKPEGNMPERVVA